jgi:hypothetical protein
MLSAQSDVHVDTAEVRVTQWRLAPGSEKASEIVFLEVELKP